MSSLFKRVVLAGVLALALSVVFAGPAAADSVVTLKVLDEYGNGVPGGEATPACGGTWQADLPGVTDASGNLAATLPACTTKVRMTVNQGSVEQTSDQLTASDYTWTTQILRIWLKDHTGSAITDEAGLLQEGGGYWYSWGNFNASGYKDIPLFDRASTYKFKVTYNSTSQEKFPVVTAGAGIQEYDFQTGQVLGTCITQYSTGAWRAFTSGMELMPGTYTFRYPSQSGIVTAGGVTNLTGCATNAPPTVDTAAGDATGDEGSALTTSGSFTDPDSDALTITKSSGMGTVTDNGGGTWSWSYTPTDNGTGNVTVTAADGNGGTVTDTFTWTADNVAPVIGTVTPAEGSLLAVSTLVNLSAAFSDAGTADTHTCTVNWDDGAGAIVGGVSETSGSGSCSSSKTFSATGVYSVVVTVTDDDDGSDTRTILVVVYDPSAGFVTGGGWINSPAGAYVADDTLVGKANFGFVSKYKKGATVPDGQTEFQFKAGDLNFKSTVYQWLVVSGKQKAQYKGSGTINGTGDYGFMVTLYDGGNSGDKFRIKIWDKNAGDAIVYDSGLADPDTLDGGLTPLGGGSIVIHAK